MSKVNKLFLILGVILFSIMLTSCYKEEKFTFKEGKYEYTGEEFNFYNDVKINNISISFSLEDDIENNNNILVNRKNNLSYYVEIYISNQNNEKIEHNNNQSSVPDTSESVSSRLVIMASTASTAPKKFPTK